MRGDTRHRGERLGEEDGVERGSRAGDALRWVGVRRTEKNVSAARD